jgi:thermitase
MQILRTLFGAMKLNLFYIFTLTLLPVTVLLAQGTQSGQIIPGQYIVKFKTKSGSQVGITGQNGQQQKASRLNAAKVASQKGAALLKQMGQKFKISRMVAGTSIMQIDSQSASELDVEQLKSNPDVEYLEPNRILSLDPVEVEQMGTVPQGTDSYTQSYSNVQVTEAWSIEKAYNDGPKVIVAVIDTGLDLNHGLFKDSNSIWENTAEKNGLPGVDDDGNGYIDDINGWNFVARSNVMYDDADHGTHVAGIILGTGMDVLVMPVRESRHKIMPLKFLSGTGSGTTADAVNAMYYAVDNGAKVINNSWGGPTYSTALHEAYTYAYNNGVVVVTAAGNSAVNLDTSPMYPAALDTPSNITVIATSDADNRASFSNYSTTLSHVGAPGVSIVSSVPGSGCSAPGCFSMMSGTSMASPFVAGLAGLVIREAPQLSAYQVKGIILSSVNSIPVLATRTQTSGRVNALSAINSAKSNSATQSWAPAYSPSYKAESRSLASDSGAPAAGCGLVKALMNDSGSGGSGEGVVNVFLIFALMMVPVAAALTMRRKTKITEPFGANRRQYERFQVVREIAIKIGDEVVQSVSQTLSVGGLSFAYEGSFEKGQKIKVQLDKNGDDVDAEIVWCSSTKSYGVKFTEITETLRNRVKVLTYGADQA